MAVNKSSVTSRSVSLACVAMLGASISAHAATPFYKIHYLPIDSDPEFQYTETFETIPNSKYDVLVVTDMNEKGTITAYRRNNYNNHRGIIYLDGHWRQTWINGTYDFLPAAVNNNDDYAGYWVSRSYGNTRAYSSVWGDDFKHNLMNYNSVALGINDDGVVVGSYQEEVEIVDPVTGERNIEIRTLGYYALNENEINSDRYIADVWMGNPSRVPKIIKNNGLVATENNSSGVPNDPTVIAENIYTSEFYWAENVTGNFMLYGMNDNAGVVGTEDGLAVYADMQNNTKDYVGPQNTYSKGVAFDVNNQGTVVGHSVMKSCYGYDQTCQWAWLWQDGVTYNLNNRAVPVDSELELDSARTINENGQIAGLATRRYVDENDNNRISKVIYRLDPNTPPIADAGSDLVVEAIADGVGRDTKVMLDGIGSTDPDNPDPDNPVDELRYNWANSPDYSVDSSYIAELSLGTHEISLSVKDYYQGSPMDKSIEVDTVAVTVQVTRPSTIAAIILDIQAEDGLNNAGFVEATTSLLANAQTFADNGDIAQAIDAVENSKNIVNSTGGVPPALKQELSGYHDDVLAALAQ